MTEVDTEHLKGLFFVWLTNKKILRKFYKYPGCNLIDNNEYLDFTCDTEKEAYRKQWGDISPPLSFVYAIYHPEVLGGGYVKIGKADRIDNRMDIHNNPIPVVSRLKLKCAFTCPTEAHSYALEKFLQELLKKHLFEGDKECYDIHYKQFFETLQYELPYKLSEDDEDLQMFLKDRKKDKRACEKFIKEQTALACTTMMAHLIPNFDKVKYMKYPRSWHYR